jgi:hypothetical protein
MDPPLRAREQTQEYGMETPNISCQEGVQISANSMESNAYSLLAF